jgi:hypothetical protein
MVFGDLPVELVCSWLAHILSLVLQ